jgi:PKD repeat protein
MTFPAPAISPSVSSFSEPIRACNQTKNTTFVITNSGGSDLTYSIGALPAWINATPTSGILSPGISDTIHITYGSGGFSSNNYNTNINITTNDPLHPVKVIPFTMAVDYNPCVTVSSIENTCNGFSTFTVDTTNVPTSFAWDFGDGTTDNVQNPVHSYPSNGNYVATLIACNAAGCDTVVYPVHATITGPRACNCYPTTISYCCNVGIVNLTISGPLGQLINNSSSDAFDGYTDFTCTDTASLVTNYPYAISVSTGFGFPESVKMWIDLNDDGMLDSLTEILYSDSAVLAFHSGTFTIPHQASNAYGPPLRLRISSDFSGNPQPTPCTNLQMGQAEDYSIFLGYYNGTNEIERETGFNVYPNPFSESSTIDYKLRQSSKVSVEIFNLLGDNIGAFASDEIQSAGKHTYQFNKQASGIYFIKLTVDGKSSVKKIVKM